MRVFIDTSSLFKKYHVEEGSRQLANLLKDVSEIIVSPITYLEITNTIHRFYHDAKINKHELEILCTQINHDFQYFIKISWNDHLENTFLHWVNKYYVKSLDIIQLASAQHSRCEQFITSDKIQYKLAKEELNKAVLL